MTEAEWFACRDPSELLNAANLRVSVRKLGLVIARCCAAAASVVESTEVKSVLTLLAEAAGPEDFLDRLEAQGPLTGAVATTALGLAYDLRNFADRPVASACDVLEFLRELDGRTSQDDPRRADLVRDVVPPLGYQPRVRAFWLRRNDSTARKIAQTIDNEKRFAELPILADALEDAGCDDQRILAHCRTAAHGDGCWVLELLLRGRD
jgi:hypothetical protein